MAFAHIDTNHNGQIGGRELKAAFEFMEKGLHFKIPAKAVEWIKDQAVKDAGEAGPKNSMNEAEFG